MMTEYINGKEYIKLGNLTKKWFWWDVTVPRNGRNIKIHHLVYWKNGILCRHVYTDEVEIYNGVIVDFNLECGKAYKQWCEIYGA